ncbi:extracellular solute-binding protein [Nonomuraea sp. MCN248]|uniref:Extracellular solute-binding protein n=1 Tax=Nonomuraea corallina TaxID=2989783 RepID=A0ABT4SE07_9ACTN|nr:extracellular solute-binding protein [Nonomuraea corallina]MDA0635439.1 extracellular solute-binding protein [Nonomuraea corallina]
MAVALTVAGCGSATRTDPPSAEAQRKLVVWDWKSGEPAAAAYVAKAKAVFAERHPGVTVEFVAQPFDQYYTLLGTASRSNKAPDVMLFNGGGQIRDRAGMLLPLDPYVAEDRDRLAGWGAFSEGGKVYAAPVTLQGHPIYYNRSLYEAAGLDPAAPPGTWDEFVSGCAAIKRRTGAACFALGNKEGFGIQFFLSGLGSGILTPREYDDWIAGERDWTSPHVRRIFELWKDAGDQGLNNGGANSTAMFTDVFRVFQTGKAAHIIGLMSDIGHWKDFGEFLPPEKLGVMPAPVVTDGAAPSLPYDGGIGYAVAKGTKDPALAAGLVRALTSAEALTAFYAEAGAITSDTTIDVSKAGPAAAAIASQIRTGKPALHVALSSKTLDVMGRLSQKLLSGSITVDGALEQLAASDRTG